MCIASQYPYFDYFEAILQDLYTKLNEKDGLKNTIEAYIYRIVFHINTPREDKTVINYNSIMISLPKLEELPYACQSFFNILFQNMDIETIIKTFTHLLFEEKIIVVMENVEDLLPVCSALHSLIYPFEYCTFAPYLINDGEEEDINSLQQVSQPFTYFMGVAAKDYELVKRNLEQDEYPSPLLVDLRRDRPSKDKDIFIRVDKSSYTFISDGMSKQLSGKKKEEMLPSTLHSNLKSKIKSAIE